MAGYAPGPGGGGGCDGGHGSPAEAPRAPREGFAYVACSHRGTGVDAPDFLAVVELHPDSDACGRVVHRTSMPYVGDGLHQFGRPARAGLPGAGAPASPPRAENLVVSGIASSRLYILNVSVDPRRPEVDRVIEPALLARKTGYTRPHTVRGMPGGIVAVAMLGNRDGEAPGGLAVLDAKTFEVLGRWEEHRGGQEGMHDFWYQPRAGVLFSSEWAVPSVFEPGFRAGDLEAGRYGRRLHVWDLKERRLLQTVAVGEDGPVPLEVRGLHDPAAEEGYVSAAFGRALWHWHRAEGGGFAFDRVAADEPPEARGRPAPASGSITDQVISMDDRYLYVSDWLHGDIRQYDITDRAHPRLHSRVWAGGLLREVRHRGAALGGGPLGLQLSLDGRRLYATNAFFPSWDDQFYPGLRSWMLKIDIDIDAEGDTGMRLDPDFRVDFAAGPGGPARAHAMGLPDGDPTTEIFA